MEYKIELKSTNTYDCPTNNWMDPNSILKSRVLFEFFNSKATVWGPSSRIVRANSHDSSGS